MSIAVYITVISFMVLLKVHEQCCAFSAIDETGSCIWVHCCWIAQVYSLGPRIVLIQQSDRIRMLISRTRLFATYYDWNIAPSKPADIQQAPFSSISAQQVAGWYLRKDKLYFGFCKLFCHPCYKPADYRRHLLHFGEFLCYNSHYQL